MVLSSDISELCTVREHVWVIFDVDLLQRDTADENARFRRQI